MRKLSQKSLDLDFWLGFERKIFVYKANIEQANNIHLGGKVIVEWHDGPFPEGWDLNWFGGDKNTASAELDRLVGEDKEVRKSSMYHRDNNTKRLKVSRLNETKTGPVGDPLLAFPSFAKIRRTVENRGISCIGMKGKKSAPEVGVRRVWSKIW